MENVKDKDNKKKLVARQGRGALNVRTDLKGGVKITLSEEYGPGFKSIETK